MHICTLYQFISMDSLFLLNIIKALDKHQSCLMNTGEIQSLQGGINRNVIQGHSCQFLVNINKKTKYHKKTSKIVIIKIMQFSVS